MDGEKRSLSDRINPKAKPKDSSHISARETGKNFT